MKTIDKILAVLVVGVPVAGVSVAVGELTLGYTPPPSFADVAAYSYITDPVVVAYLAGFAAWCFAVWVVRRALTRTLSCEGWLARHVPWLPQAGVVAMTGAMYMALMFVSVVVAFVVNMAVYITGDAAAIWADDLTSAGHVANGAVWWAAVYALTGAAGLIVRADPVPLFKVGSEHFVASIHCGGERWQVHFAPKRSSNDQTSMLQELTKFSEALQRLGDRKPRVIRMDSHLLAGKKGRKVLLERFAGELGYQYQYAGQPSRLSWLQRKFRVLLYPQLKEDERKGLLDYTQKVTLWR